MSNLRFQKQNGNNIFQFVDPADQRRSLFARTVFKRIVFGGKRHASSEESLRLTVPYEVVDGERTWTFVGQAKIELMGFNEAHKLQIINALTRVLTYSAGQDFFKGATLPLISEVPFNTSAPT